MGGENESGGGKRWALQATIPFTKTTPAIKARKAGGGGGAGGQPAHFSDCYSFHYSELQSSHLHFFAPSKIKDHHRPTCPSTVAKDHVWEAAGSGSTAEKRGVRQLSGRPGPPRGQETGRPGPARLAGSAAPRAKLKTVNEPGDRAAARGSRTALHLPTRFS